MYPQSSTQFFQMVVSEDNRSAIFNSSSMNILLMREYNLRNVSIRNIA